MNRRGFFGALAAVPAVLRGKLPLTPVAQAAVPLFGDLPAGATFFSVDRTAMSRMDAVHEMLAAGLIDPAQACRLLDLPEVP